MYFARARTRPELRARARIGVDRSVLAVLLAVEPHVDVRPIGVTLDHRPSGIV